MSPQLAIKIKKYFKSRDRHLMCHLLFSEENHLLRTRKKTVLKNRTTVDKGYVYQRVRLPQKSKNVLTAIEDIFPGIPVPLITTASA